MRKVLVFLLGLGLAVTVQGCGFFDFGDTDDDNDQVEGEIDVPEQPEEVAEEIKEGTCTPGQSAGYTFVMVEDAADNPTLVDCNTNPGADLDSICIYRADELVGCAAEVAYTPVDPVPCEQNDKDDPEQVLGPPDGIAGNGEFSGYFSLNGGFVIVGFEAGLEMLCGDVIEVVEMHNAEDPDATVEQYRTSMGSGTDCLGAGTDCLWALTSDWAVGHDEIDVTWDW